MTSLLTLPTLINCWWQSCLILGAGWLWYRLALRQEAGFGYNRRFLRLTPLLALVLPPLLALTTPLFQDWLPAQEPNSLTLLRPSVLLPAVSASSSGSVEAPAEVLPWLLGLYALGTALLLVRLGMRLWRLHSVAGRLPHESRDGYVLVRTAGQLPTSSFGRRIFWDDTTPLTEAEAHLVLRHEIAHVRQHHSTDRLLLELLRSVLWLNPFVHLFPRALELTHEYLADEAVLGRAPAPAAATVYGALLARLTLQRLHIADLPLAHSFTYSQTLNRIAMLKTSHPARRWKHWLPLPAAAVLLLTLAATNVSAQITPPPPPPPPALAPPPPPPPPMVPTTPPEKVYDKVDQMPEYPGGQAKLMQDIMANVKYPAEAKAAGLGGKVLIEFVVNAKGRISVIDFKQRATAPAGQQALAQQLDKAATDAVLGVSNAQWKPGRNKGKAVSVSYIVPITFAL